MNNIFPTKHVLIANYLSNSSQLFTVYDCEFPAALADGTISAPVTTWNAVATYECNQGYDLDGTATRTCQHGGQWSGEAATCESK